MPDGRPRTGRASANLTLDSGRLIIALLAGHRVVRRTRSAGQGVDDVTLDPRALDPTGFAGATYPEQATLAREALDLLEDGPTVRRSMLQKGAALYDLLAERMPALLTEWHARRDDLARAR